MLNELPGISTLGKMIKTVIEARDKLSIEAVKPNVVRLPTMGYQAFDFNLTPAQLQPMFNASYNAIITHLETYQSEAGRRVLSESYQSQVENKAITIINNTYHINQYVESMTGSGSVVAVKTGDEP